MKDKEHDFSKDSEAVIPDLTTKDCGNTRTLLSENRFTKSTGSERNGSSQWNHPQFSGYQRYEVVVFSVFKLQTSACNASDTDE